MHRLSCAIQIWSNNCCSTKFSWQKKVHNLNSFSFVVYATAKNSNHTRPLIGCLNVGSRQTNIAYYGICVALTLASVCVSKLKTKNFRNVLSTAHRIRTLKQADIKGDRTVAFVSMFWFDAIRTEIGARPTFCGSDHIQKSYLLKEHQCPDAINVNSNLRYWSRHQLHVIFIFRCAVYVRFFFVINNATGKKEGTTDAW